MGDGPRAPEAPELPPQQPQQKKEPGEHSSSPPPREQLDQPAESEPLFRFDEVLARFGDDPALLPVLVVVLGIFATFGTAALTLALQRNLPAIGAVTGLALLTLLATEEDRKARRFGARTKAALAFWGLSIAGAVAVYRLGL